MKGGFFEKFLIVALGTGVGVAVVAWLINQAIPRFK